MQAIGQTGIHFADDGYHLQRYQRLFEIAAETISAFTTMDEELLTEILQDQIGYATPLVDVRGSVFRSGELLSVQERFDQEWTLPSGWADVGVSLCKGKEREVWKNQDIAQEQQVWLVITMLIVKTRYKYSMVIKSFFI